MVIKRFVPACILTSEGGLGKSYLVRKMLKDQCKKEDFEIRSGHITPLALYKLLYKFRTKIVVLDDVEELLKSDIVVGILKAGLWDVEGNGKREITWASTSEKLGATPQKFVFSGGIILLCNKIPRKYDAVVKALRTRGLEYTIRLTYEQKLRIFKELIDTEDFYDSLGLKLDETDRATLKEALEENTSVLLESFNFRTVVKLITFYVYNKKYHPEKKELYLDLMEKTNKQDEEKKIVWEMMRSDFPMTQQIQLFFERTGKSRATFYRIKKKLEIETGKKLRDD